MGTNLIYLQSVQHRFDQDWKILVVIGSLVTHPLMCSQSIMLKVRLVKWYYLGKNGPSVAKLQACSLPIIDLKKKKKSTYLLLLSSRKERNGLKWTFNEYSIYSFLWEFCGKEWHASERSISLYAILPNIYMSIRVEEHKSKSL